MWFSHHNPDRRDDSVLPSPRVRKQIERLQAEKGEVRRTAASALGKLGAKQALEALCMALGDKEWYVRLEAAEALGQIGDTRAVEALCAALTEQDSYVRGAAARALGQIGDVRAVERLGQALQEEVFPHCAAKALMQIGGTRAVERLCIVLQEGNRYLRLSVAEAMAEGDLRNSQAIKPLCGALQDADFSVRSYAARALGRTQDAGAVDPLCNALTDKNFSVRCSAAEALGLIGDIRAAEPLCVAMKDSEVGVFVTEALRRLAPPAEIPLRVLSAPTLTSAQKLNALQALLNAPARILSYSFLSVQAFCEQIGRQAEPKEQVKLGAKAVLEELRKQEEAQTLLRAGMREEPRDKQELLRGISDHAGTTAPGELLRSSDASSRPSIPPRPGIFSRIFKKR